MIRALLALLALAAAACSARPSTSASTAELVNVNPSTWSFGTVSVGASATPRTIVVAPQGLMPSYDEIVSVTESCNDFSVDTSGFDVPPVVARECEPDQALICFNTTQSFTAHFAPTVAGTQSCTVTIELGQQLKTLTLTGTGTPPPYALTLVTPLGGTLAFGDVVVGTTSAARSIVVRNDGGNDLTIASAAIGGASPGDYTVTSGDPSASLAPGESYTWELTCTPAAAGARPATFVVTSQAPDSPRTVDLGCEGIQSNLAIAPSPLQFDEVLVGRGSTETLTLTNTGSAPLTIDAVSISPAVFTFTGPDTLTLAPAEQTTIDVTFTPTMAELDTDVAGALVVAFDGGETRMVDLIGPARWADLSVTPGGELDFGTVCGGQPRSELFVALNTGSGELVVESVEVTGAGFTLMPVQPAMYPEYLAARTAATFRVTAAPAPGPATGELRLTTDLPAMPIRTVTLVAAGLASGIAPNPAAVAFDSLPLLDVSEARTVRLANCDPTPLTVTSAALVGRDAGEFEILTAELDTLPGTIPAGDDRAWILQLQPSSAGAKEASLELVHDRGTTIIPLTGVVDQRPGDGGRGTYYACDAGGPRGLAPVALVVLVVVAPRRRRQRA